MSTIDKPWEHGLGHVWSSDFINKRHCTNDGCDAVYFAWSQQAYPTACQSPKENEMTDWSQPATQEAVRSLITKLRGHLRGRRGRSQNVAAPISVPREDILDAADALEGLLEHTPVSCCDLKVCNACTANTMHTKELGPLSWIAWCHSCGAGGRYDTLRRDRFSERTK